MFNEKRALSNHINLPTCPGEILFQFLSRAEPQFSMFCLRLVRSIPSDSDSEKSACKAADPSSTPRMQRSTGEGNGYPLQYLSWRNFVPFLIQSRATILNALLRAYLLLMGESLSTAMAKSVEEVGQIIELRNYRTKNKLYSPYEINGDRGRSLMEKKEEEQRADREEEEEETKMVGGRNGRGKGSEKKEKEGKSWWQKNSRSRGGDRL